MLKATIFSRDNSEAQDYEKLSLAILLPKQMLFCVRDY